MEHTCIIRELNSCTEVLLYTRTASRNALHNQTGYMRYDLEVMINAASNKKKARSATDNLFGTMQRLDYALGKKNMGDATFAYEGVVEAMDDVMAAVG